MVGSVHSQGVRQDCKQGFEGAGGTAPSPHPGPGREPWRGAGRSPAEQNSSPNFLVNELGIPNV